jgi:hypothetical protein
MQNVIAESASMALSSDFDPVILLMVGLLPVC